jgi:hypothetical protein
MSRRWDITHSIGRRDLWLPILTQPTKPSPKDNNRSVSIELVDVDDDSSKLIAEWVILSRPRAQYTTVDETWSDLDHEIGWWWWSRIQIDVFPIDHSLSTRHSFYFLDLQITMHLILPIANHAPIKKSKEIST